MRSQRQPLTHLDCGWGARMTSPGNPCPAGSHHVSRRWLDEGDRGSSDQSPEEELERRVGTWGKGSYIQATGSGLCPCRQWGAMESFQQ